MIAVAVLLLIVLLIGSDLVIDYRSGTTAGHIALEGIVIIIGLGGAVAFFAVAQQYRREVAELDARLAAAHAAARQWRQETKDLLAGLGAAIDRQFEQWQLTPAEREVGLLLLKGLTHKEIAHIRSVGDRTVRQQALAVYRKAGLTGRADLAAFFLEDLLLPSAQVAESPG